MPVTRNLSPENTAPEECDEQICSIDNARITEESSQTQALDNIDEVSSTTVDSDPVAGTNLNPAVCMDATDSDQLTSSLNALPDSQKDQAASFDESASNPSSSTAASGSNVNRGFQDAFAAFASASCRDLEDEESPMDVTNSTSEQVAVADSVGSSVAEPLVSSADDSSQVTTTGESFVAYEPDAGNVYSDTTDIKEDYAFHKMMSNTDPDTDSQSSLGEEQALAAKLAAQAQLGESNETEAAVTSDSVYFIQTTDASGQVVTSIIDPNDIPSYSDSVVYKQCMKADGEIETTIVYSGGMAVGQEEPAQEQEVTNSGETEIQQGEQIIYAHDISGQLTPIDPVESANDVAPPGKQFVYMQDSTGRIIRTVMDANQTMVPGQQVYYTQSDDGRIITSVMDSAASLVSEDSNQEQQSLQAGDQVYQQQQQMGEADTSQQQQEATSSMVGRTSGFNIDNSMSGLSMLAELSHLTAGQATTTLGPATEQRAASSTDSSNSNDMDEFRPVAMVTRRLASEDGVESVGSDIAELKVGETDSDSFDQSSLLQGDSTGPGESIVARIVSQMNGEQAQPSYTVSRDNLFVQWQNLDAMCWMDVVLIMLVYSPTLRPLVNMDPNHELASTLLITLLKANRQAQVLLQNLLKKNNGAVISDVQTGAGNLASIQDPKTSKLVCKENMDEIGKAINILYAMREKIWQGLQPRLRCERGKHNSPVLVLPLLVREKPDIKQMFTMSYRYVFKCEKCSYSQDDRHTKILPSIPAVPEDFNMKEPCFVRNCFECKAPNQRMVMKFEQLQDFVQMHFVKGLPHNRFEELSFDFNDDHYEVTTVVHYKNNPDHFIAWVRNAPGPAWMECDDLKSVITRYLHTSPSIPPSQVHMVMWERRLTPQHTLIMRDTEDTKLLASLVLTVQQPNAHQPTDLGATTAAATTQAPPTNLLSGLMTQTFTPYASRGRSRDRTNRGSYSNRGRAALTTPIIRRVSPVVTQVLSSSAASNPTTSSQIVRLPLSALASSGLNLRGSTPGGARYVLVGNSSQAGAATSTALNRAGTPSKVVVVRSQGGASNISAAQLLQLLQRTGAISQVGTRFTTTMTTSGANTVTPSAATTSFIIQQDGSITATTISKDAHTTEQSAEAPMETETINEQTSSASLGSQTISTLSYSGADQSTHPDTHAAISQAGTANTINEDAPGEHPGMSGQTVAISQQPGRYIRVPNPAGGGMLMCMVGMRDGKIVLVPVDKNTQAKVAGQSILRLSSTQAASSKISTIAAGSTPQMLTASSAGSVLTQLQKQLVQAQTVSPGTSTGPRFITLPATSGNKRIQLITVPRGQADQPKTVTMTTQQVGSNTASTSTNTDGRILSQSSNIVIREVKRPESDNTASLPTSLCTLDLSSGQLVSTPAVSLLKDVSARLSTPTTSRTSSLLSCLSEQQKPQESFRYIIPGSSTTHILHTGPSGAQTGLSPAGRIFTALSSSGTIIGGQLTPSPGGSSSTADQGLTISEIDDNTRSPNILTAKRRLSKELDTTEYIPLGRGRGGRGKGGRVRARSQLWGSDAELIAPASTTNSRKISTLADLRQIGAHIIEAGSEAVDGIPVVSIPDYSTEGASQTEILSGAHSIISEMGRDNIGQDVSSLSHASQGTEQEATADQEPRVITQQIPSMKVNHGFDILTQGILGSANTARQSPLQKPARSLLTGAKNTLQSASSLLASLSETTASSLASAVQSIGQAEIETLMQAAQAAARPGEARSQTTSSQLTTDSGFSLDDQLTYNDMNSQETGESSNEDRKKRLLEQLRPEAEQDISEQMSIDDNQVSAAERYRMPVELFQPDEESPEKSMKVDVDTNRLAADLSPRQFHSYVDSPHQDEMTKCTQQQNKDVGQESLRRKFTEKQGSPNNGDSTGVSMDPSRLEDSTVDLRSPAGAIEAFENMESESASNELPRVQDAAQPGACPKKASSHRRGRRRASNKRGGRRKLDAATGHEPMESTHTNVSNETAVSGAVATCESSPERFTQISSPVKESLQHSASIEDIATNSLIESDTVAKNLVEGAEQNKDDILDSHDDEKTGTPRKASRSRGKAKGRTSNRGGKRKSNISNESADIETIPGVVSSPERSIQQSSPEKESCQPFPSSEGLDTDSLMESNSEVTDKVLEVLPSGDPLQEGYSDVRPDTSLTMKKVGRPKGRSRASTSKRGGTQKSYDTSEPAPEEANHTLLSDTTSAIEMIQVASSGASPNRKSIEIFSPEKEALQLSSSPNSFVTDSFMEADDIRPKEALKGESPDALLDSHQDEAGHDTHLTPKKAGRPRGRSKGGSSKGRGKRKSADSSVLEPHETIDTCLSDLPMSSPGGTFTDVSSPVKESVKLASSPDPAVHTIPETSSIGHVVTDSLMEPAESTPEKLNGHDSVAMESGHDDELGCNSNLTPKKAGRPPGSFKRRSGKRGSRWKSNGSSVPEPDATVEASLLEATVGASLLEATVEASHLDATAEASLPDAALASSTGDNFTQISSMHVSSTSPAKSNIVDVGEDVTDILLECDHSAVETQEVLKSVYLHDVPPDISKRKENLKKVTVQSTFTKKPPVSPALIHYKKKANWDVGSDSAEVVRPGSSYNYKVLSGRPAASHARHPSLGPAQESFTSPPTPLPSSRKPRKSNSPDTSSPALVIRKRPKLQPESSVYSHKGPTVVPLIMKDGGDAACTGGSVVTSASGEEMFTGVLASKKAKVDWSCSVSDQEEVLEDSAEQELKTAQRRYCKQLMTVFYMEAGDFSAAIGLSSSCPQTSALSAEEAAVLKDEEATVLRDEEAAVLKDEEATVLRDEEATVLRDEEAAVVRDEATVLGDKEATVLGDEEATVLRDEEATREETSGTPSVHDQTGDSDKAVGDLEETSSAQPSRTVASSRKGKQKKRRSVGSRSSNSSRPAKQAKSVHDEDSSHVLGLPESVNPSSVATPSRVNGVEAETSSTSLSQSATFSEHADDQREVTRPTFSFPSPTRRSGRTPIPSKKVLDSLEDTSFLSLLKVRRVSSVSSDDTQSGYTSDDTPHKKGNTASSTS